MKSLHSSLMLSTVLGLSLFGLTSSAMADSTAYSLDNTTGQSLANAPFTLGSVFTANANMNVTAIGIFDNNLDGLVDSYSAGIFDSAGNFLGGTTISSGTVDPLTNQFRYASMAPVALTAGQTYEVGAVYLDGNDPLIFPGAAVNFSTDSSITFKNASYNTGSTLAAPLTFGANDPSYFGPNFMFTTTAVPEPGSVALGLMFAGSSLSILVRRRNRK